MATNDTKMGRNWDKYSGEISKATWLSPQYVKRQVLKVRLGTYFKLYFTRKRSKEK